MEKAAELQQAGCRTPWLVAMCGYIHNRTLGEEVWTASAYHRAFNFNVRAYPQIGPVVTDDLKITLKTLEIKSHADFFWLKTSRFKSLLKESRNSRTLP